MKEYKSNDVMRIALIGIRQVPTSENLPRTSKSEVANNGAGLLDQWLWPTMEYKAI
jgi:hypothetical protein